MYPTTNYVTNNFLEGRNYDQSKVPSKDRKQLWFEIVLFCQLWDFDSKFMILQYIAFFSLYLEHVCIFLSHCFCQKEFWENHEDIFCTTRQLPWSLVPNLPAATPVEYCNSRFKKKKKKDVSMKLKVQTLVWLSWEWE